MFNKKLKCELKKLQIAFSKSQEWRYELKHCHECKCLLLDHWKEVKDYLYGSSFLNVGAVGIGTSCGGDADSYEKPVRILVYCYKCKPPYDSIDKVNNEFVYTCKNVSCDEDGNIKEKSHE